MRQVKVFSTGKIIISGEHSVVYGQPAVVAGIDLGMRVALADELGRLDQLEWQTWGDLRKSDAYINQIGHIFEKKYQSLDSQLWIKISSHLPQKSGLGSSAVLASALFQVFANWYQIDFSQDELFQLVHQAEKYMHGQSSGVDPAGVVYGGLLKFELQKNKPRISRLNNQVTDWQLVLVDSGQAEESTKEMVALVRQLDQPDVIKQMGQVTQKLIKSLELGKFDPELIIHNQRCLEKIGVVGKKASAMIDKMAAHGVVAKVSGAGGVKAGSGWLLSWHQDPSVAIELAQKNDWPFLLVTVAKSGV